MVESTIVIGYDATQNYALKKKLSFLSYFSFDRFVCSASTCLWLIPFMTLFGLLVLDWRLFYRTDILWIVNIALCVWFIIIQSSLHLKTCPCQLNANACNSCFNIISISLDNRHVQRSRTENRRPNLATTMTFYWDTRIENELYANDENETKNWYETA